MVAARHLPRGEPFPFLRNLGAGRLRPGLDDVGPRACRHLRPADAGRRPGCRFQRRDHPDAGFRRLDRLSPLPPRHEPGLAVARRRLSLRLLVLHARTADRPPAPDVGLPTPARGTRGSSLRRGLAGWPRPRDRPRRAARHAGLVRGRGAAHDRACAPRWARARLSRRARAPSAPPQRGPTTRGRRRDCVRPREPVARGDADRARPPSRERAGTLSDRPPRPGGPDRDRAREVGDGWHFEPVPRQRSRDGGIPRLAGDCDARPLRQTQLAGTGGPVPSPRRRALPRSRRWGRRSTWTAGASSRCRGLWPHTSCSCTASCRRG